MPAKGHLLQWVLNYSDPKNYVLFQLDDTDFYRAVIRNGAKTNEMKVPAKGDKKSFRTLQSGLAPRKSCTRSSRVTVGPYLIVVAIERQSEPGKVRLLYTW